MLMQQKSTENRSFRCFLELLGGFEPPASSLPSDKMPSSRWYIRLCGRFYPKKNEVGNSLLHMLRPFVSPCGSRCGSAPQSATVWVNFRWQGEWSHFALLGTIKGYHGKDTEPPGGEQCSRRVALQVLGMLPVWVKMWVKAFSTHQETAAEHRR